MVIKQLKSSGLKPKKARPPKTSMRPRSVIDRLVAIGNKIPEADLEQYPRDLAKHFDHYAHGSPRQD